MRCESDFVVLSYETIIVSFFVGDFSISLTEGCLPTAHMASRPLTSLALPARLLGKLTAVGYTTVSELRDLDADSLANGQWLPAFPH